MRIVILNIIEVILTVMTTDMVMIYINNAVNSIRSIYMKVNNNYNHKGNNDSGDENNICSENDSNDNKTFTFTFRKQF